jgi:hypothetical protein
MPWKFLVKKYIKKIQPYKRDKGGPKMKMILEIHGHQIN